MIKKFWHTGITVQNRDEAIKYYQNLGFGLVDKFEKDEPHALTAELQHPSGPAIEIWQWLDKNHPQIEFIKDHLAFVSDNQDADIQALVEQGWEIVIPKTKGIKVTYVFLRDPSGNFVEIADIKE